jgi:replicative superfamily II helicase
LQITNAAQLIRYYGIPTEIVAAYELKGIKTLYQWQMECLQIEGVLDGRNLIYSSPTSGGKTMGLLLMSLDRSVNSSTVCVLVAEILMIRRIILDKKKCLFILPYVSLVIEKTKDLKVWIFLVIDIITL